MKFPKCEIAHPRRERRRGLGAETITRIERGLVPPTLAKLFEFAKLLGCRVDELLLEASNRNND